MTDDRNETQHSSTERPGANAPGSGADRDQPPQPDAERARPPRGYDDPLRRERNSGLVPPDADADADAGAGTR